MKQWVVGAALFCALLLSRPKLGPRQISGSPWRRRTARECRSKGSTSSPRRSSRSRARQVGRTVVLVARKGKLVYADAVGFQDKRKKVSPMGLDALFRIYSMTKPLSRLQL